MTDKPCPKCEGFECTIENYPHVEFCDFHVGEIMKQINKYLDENPLIYATPAGHA
jgi:hypothetical protein